MSTLITGASGFSGRELIKIIPGEKLLLSRKVNVDQVGRNDIIECDLIDAEEIREIIREKKPDKIYNLAGSFTNDFDVDFQVNVTATKNILDAVKDFIPKTRVLLIGSAAEYGLISKEQCPVNETDRLRPHNVYGLTKVYQKYLMDYYVNVLSMDIVLARPFNLYGRGASTLLFIGKIYHEIEKFKKGLISEILLGNLDSERDYISIEEAVNHYVRIMDYGFSGQEYNVAKGFPVKISDILKIILEEEGVPVSVVKANQRNHQPNDSDVVYADINKLMRLYDE